ncbi:zinc finger protein 771-like [Corythoichthys intestinalis]|uniref:zinc finger protein 771-like n=1 Tax=Corythoichthys intestinalis TaxID=161448 RepID=UPI0025A4F7B7|nr:zinc finger protein 771-like [Corythoichthys intestinalis]
MFARTTPTAEKFQEELCGVKEEPPRHQDSTVCKIMHAKVVLRRLEDLYVSQAHRLGHQESACIKGEEEESPYIKEEESVHIQGFRKYLGAEEEPESHEVKEHIELPQIKEEEPEPCQQNEREDQIQIKKEAEELPSVKEEEGSTRSTGEPLKSEDGLSEASRGAQPASSSSISTEGLQADIFIAPSDRNGATSHLPDNDDGHNKSHGDEKLCKCSQCGKIFANKKTFCMQMRSHTGKKPFLCSVCGQGLTRKQNLQSHNETHTGKTFSCSVCGQRFSHKITLRRHTRTHTGEKPFVCSFCGQRFRHQSNLKIHTRNHTGEKPFSCSVCGQGFRHGSNLKIHSRTHTGEKPFSCSVCDQRFSQKQNLKTHERTHTGEKPFSCSVCGQRFSHKINLKRHTRTHTGEKYLAFGFSPPDREPPRLVEEKKIGPSQSGNANDT